MLRRPAGLEDEHDRLRLAFSGCRSGSGMDFESEQVGQTSPQQTQRSRLKQFPPANARMVLGVATVAVHGVSPIMIPFQTAPTFPRQAYLGHHPIPGCAATGFPAESQSRPRLISVN